MDEEVLESATENVDKGTLLEESSKPTSNTNFLDVIDNQFREDPSISKFSNVNDLVKEHVNLQSLLGRKGVILPKEGDSEEIWNKYRSEMNVPSEFSGYLNEETSEENELPSHLAKVAHENNLSLDQYQNIIKGYESWQQEYNVISEKEINLKTNENINSLRKEWGRAFEAKTDIGASALNNLTNGNSEAIANMQLSDGTFLGNNPDFIRIMASIGETLQEKGLMEGITSNTSAMSPEEAQSKIAGMMADPEKAAILFSQDFHPSKEELVKERERLLSFAYPQD